MTIPRSKLCGGLFVELGAKETPTQIRVHHFSVTRSGPQTRRDLPRSEPPDEGRGPWRIINVRRAVIAAATCEGAKFPASSKVQQNNLLLPQRN